MRLSALMSIGLAACAGGDWTASDPARTSGPDLETGFIVNATEEEIRSVIEGHPDGLDADHVVDLYRAPFECWKFFDLCWDVSEAGALEVLRGEWGLISAGVAGEDLNVEVVALINLADDSHPPGVHLTSDEERRFATFVGAAPSTNDEWISDHGEAGLPQPMSIAGEDIGRGSGAFDDTSDSRFWCWDDGRQDDVTSTYGTLNVKASSPVVAVGTVARVKATSTTARDLEIDGEYAIMTLDNSAPLPYIRTEHAYTQAFDDNALSIVLNSSETGANYKGSGGCATADGSAEWCACRNPLGAVYDL